MWLMVLKWITVVIMVFLTMFLAIHIWCTKYDTDDEWDRYHKR